MKPRIYLAVLTRGKVDHELVEWLISQIDMSNNKSCSYEIAVVDISTGTPLTANANNVAKKFLASNCDRILLLDDDITPPPDTIEKLFDDNCDIVGARILFSQPHFSGPMSCAGISQGENKPFRLIDTIPGLDKLGPVMKVDFLGFGCTMIKRKVFESMQAPFFTQKFSKDGTELIKGTDTKFCQRATSKGFGVYCDIRLLTGQKTTINLIEIVNKMLKMKENFKGQTE